MERLLLEQAAEILLSHTEKITACEEISLWDAVGRVLAEDIYATRNQPPFSRSPLDGYAVRSEDIRGALRERPVRLRVIDEVDAGHVTEKKVEPGLAVRIMTGAPIPEGADCIIGQEDTDYELLEDEYEPSSDESIINYIFQFYYKYNLLHFQYVHCLLFLLQNLHNQYI